MAARTKKKAPRRREIAWALQLVGVPDSLHGLGGDVDVVVLAEGDRIVSANVVIGEPSSHAGIALVVEGMIGSGVDPTRVVVDPPEWVGPLVDVLGEGIDVVAGVHPELDGVARELAENLRGNDGPMLLDDGVVRVETARALFEAYAQFTEEGVHALWPSDSHGVAIECPSLGVRQGVVLVLGRMDESVGWLLFDTVAGMRRMNNVGSQLMDMFLGGRPRKVTLPRMSFTSEKAGSLPLRLVAAGKKHGFRFVAGRVPRLEQNSGESGGLPTEEEARAAVAITRALVELHRDFTFKYWQDWSAQASVTVGDDDTLPRVTLRAPHPKMRVEWDRVSDGDRRAGMFSTGTAGAPLGEARVLMRKVADAIEKVLDAPDARARRAIARDVQRLFSDERVPPIANAYLQALVRGGAVQKSAAVRVGKLLSPG